MKSGHEPADRPTLAANTQPVQSKHSWRIYPMAWPDCEEFADMSGVVDHYSCSSRARIRFSRDLLTGRDQKGQTLLVSRLAQEYDLDCNAAYSILADLQALGMVALSAPNMALVRSSRPKEMHEVYALRAALEEIGGRAAAGQLRGNTGEQRRTLDAMRAAVRNQDLDAYVEQDVHFHRSILEAADNDVLLRVWDSLAFDIRIRATISKVMEDLPKVVESHQPIVDALERGQALEAGLLLRNHVEAFSQFLRKAEMDSAFFYQDLKIARDVQRGFLPQQAPAIPGLSCDIFYKPAHSVGGDYYDFLPLQNGRWGIAIGDVSGKGIGAALIMASLQASVRAQALQPHSDPAALIDYVNRLVHESSPAQFYASLFYGEYDPETRILTYVNAGQNPPIVIRCQGGQSTVFRLPPGSAPVGMWEDPGYNSYAFPLEHGDIVVACTDGIIEAENNEGELWDQQRLEAVFSSCGRQNPRQVIERIVNEVSLFADGAPQKDDMTLLVVRVQAL